MRTPSHEAVGEGSFRRGRSLKKLVKSAGVSIFSAMVRHLSLLFSVLALSALLFGGVGCVFGGSLGRIPRRSDFAAPLASLKAAYPVLSFPGSQSRGAILPAAQTSPARQTPLMDAAVLVRAWGPPNVPPEAAGYGAASNQSAPVWVWQFHDKRVVVRLQIWPIRKAKPYVEKVEVFELNLQPSQRK